jgi:hypothetical protein
METRRDKSQDDDDELPELSMDEIRAAFVLAIRLSWCYVCV